MEQNRIRLMEKLDRSFVEHLRGKRVHRDSLMAVYRRLKERELSRREVTALLHFADPLAAALMCWKRVRRVAGNRYVLRMRFWINCYIAADCIAVRITFLSWMPLFSGSSRRRHAMIMSNHQIIYGGRRHPAIRGGPEVETPVIRQIMKSETEAVVWIPRKKKFPTTPYSQGNAP